MTTCATLIKEAYRESNLIAITATPTIEETAEALSLLNSIVLTFIGQELGELLEDRNVGDNNVTRQEYEQNWLDNTLANSFLPLNLRVVANLTEAKTIYLHPRPFDGARFGVVDPSENLSTYNLTFNGNGRKVEDSQQIVLATDGISREWFYRADLSDWVRVTDLEVDDESPFPRQFDDILIIALATRLNPRNGVAADPQTAARYANVLKKFRSTYKQSKQMSSEMALALVNPWYRTRTWFSDDSAFNQGRPW